MDEITGDTSTSTMDYASASEQVGNMLGEDLIGKRESAPMQREPSLSTESEPQTAAPSIPDPPKSYDVPKSWKADKHSLWGAIAPDAQSYIIEREKQLLDGFQSFRPIQEALAPHQDFLSRANIPPARAVASLLQAQRRLVEGTDEQKWQAFQELAKHLGHDKRLAQAMQAQPENSAPADPAIQTLQQRIDAVEQQAKAQWDARIAEISQSNMKAVNDFAADTKAHPYFDEVGEEMALLIRQGYSLQDAYDTAVRMNAAVYAKEQARVLTEHEAKLKENARLASLPKKKAASVNIKSNGDGPEPTEPVGTLEDTIRSVHKKILARA